MIWFISSLDIINVVVPDPNIFLWIVASVAYATANPNGINTLLAKGFDLFFIKDNPVLKYPIIVLKAYLKVLLTVVIYSIEFL